MASISKPYNRYSTTNQRHAKAEVTGELVIMNWQSAGLGQLF